MRKITLQENRKLCLALMMAGSKGVKLTSSCWQVASVIAHWSEQGRSTGTVGDFKRLLNLSGTVIRRALSRLHDSQVILVSGPNSQMSFQINWSYLDEIAAAHDRNMVDYWRHRSAGEDQYDPDAP